MNNNCTVIAESKLCPVAAPGFDLGGGLCQRGGGRGGGRKTLKVLK